MSELDKLSAEERASFEWGRVHGIYSERAAIVAWLREGGQGMKLVAAAIERGEHLGGDDE
ncbi:MAG: hypothetical protein QM286_05975 [Acidobacteriota bacterium]|nr:hypothetical protein [Acidobacteriota bacterium]